MHNHPAILTTSLEWIATIGLDDKLGQPHAGRCQGDGAEQGR